MTKPAALPAAVTASQIIDQINATVARVSAILENGMPGNPQAGIPAIAAADIAAALGADNVTKIKAAAAALA